MMQKSLDIKLTRILEDRSFNDFILADAKDADMAFGIAAPGRSPNTLSYRTADQYREQIRQIVEQGLVDIMLMSASNCEILSVEERLFHHSPITPAIRANDTTDIWLAGCEGVYGKEPSRPFRTATLSVGADLGLYSVTFNNIVERDWETLTAYKEFRLEAAAKRFRHFLEVFSPNVPESGIQNVPAFVNDHIVRTLAGVTSAERPVFLKIPYYGPAAMEAIAGYDSRLIVGILGGSAGSTLDSFQMLADAKKYGARVALFGRRINNAEDQLSFIKYLRLIADDQITPGEAVKAYHGDLAWLGITPNTETTGGERRFSY
jgi:hypothetical protein